MENYFEGFKSKLPEFNQLQAGKNQPVRINRFILTDSRRNFDGSPKENLPEYVDATPQIAVVFVSTSGQGVITHRYNGLGYKRYSELTAEEIKSGKFMDIDEYACIKTKDGVVRIEDPERTRACVNILSELFFGLGLPEGSGMSELQDAIEAQTVLAVDVKQEEYEGRPQYRVAKHRRATAETVSAESEAADSLDRY